MAHSFKANIIEFGLNIPAAYLTVYYLLPNLILKKKYLKFTISVIALLGLCYVLRTELFWWWLYENAPQIEKDYLTDAYTAVSIMTIGVGQLYVLSFVTAIILVINWAFEKRKNNELEKLQMSTELKYLRTQIEPHFFFNTLNNLYALTLIKSEKASHLVVKLSEMMHYILYDVKHSQASLKQEINHINNFIDIECLRFEDRIDSKINITGKIDHIKVPPLLYLSFVENCFKHGLKGNDKIRIHMDFNVLKNKYLAFTITNNFNPDHIKSGGIGNTNARRRLYLLFGSNFTMDTKVKDNIYKLFLKIPIR